MSRLLPLHCRLPLAHEVYHWIMGKVGQEHFYLEQSLVKALAAYFGARHGQTHHQNTAQKELHYSCLPSDVLCMTPVVYQASRTDSFPSIFQWDFLITLLGT